MNAKKIRFGVLGLSRIAQRSAIPAIVESENAELVIVGSRNPDNAREHGFPTGTYDEVLQNPEVDAVYISLPNSLHEEWAIKAATARKHIWCEKPAALTFDSAIRMVTAAKENNVRLMEGFMFLHHPQHAKVREIIKSGTIGEVISFEGRYASPKPDSSNIRFDPQLGGGAYNDMLVYPIRASRYIYDAEPISISCTMEFDFETGVDIKDGAVLTYSDGRLAAVSAEFTDDYRSTYIVIGTKGKISMERSYAVQKNMPVRIFVESSEMHTEVQYGPEEQFRLMVDDFSKELLSATKNKDYEQDLINQAKIIDAGRISGKEKRVVNLSEL